MFTLGWWRVVSLDLLARGQRACLQECFHPQRLLRFCLVKHYYGACFSTFRFVRKARDFLIQRHKLLWADCSRRRLHAQTGRENASVSQCADMRVHQRLQRIHNQNCGMMRVWIAWQQAVLDTVHVTVFYQSYVVSAGAMADTFFVTNGE